MKAYDALAEALPAYEIGEEIGRGSWGVVFAGRHRRLDRSVAIKQLTIGLAVDPEARARFLAEAKILASFDHSHIVPLHDFVEHEDVCLLVMERLRGGTLRSRVRMSPLSAPAACGAAVALAGALGYAHARGVLHRDVKPENLLFSSDGVLKVTDFGIAKVLSGPGTMYSTLVGVLGTPFYLAPEQAQSGELSPATDVYAAGIVLYELLAGRLPFPETSDPIVAIYQHVHEQPRPLIDVAPRVPVELAVVVDRAIARTPSDRFASAEAFGIAVATAAASAWGPDWAEDAGVQLREVDELLVPQSVGAAATSVPASAGGALRRLRSLKKPARWPRAVQLLATLLLGAAVTTAVLLPRTTGGQKPSPTPSESAFLGAAGHTTYLLSPASAVPGATVVVTALSPCPPVPPTLTDPVANVTLFDARAVSPTSSGNIASEDFPLTPEGSWAGKLIVPTDADPGRDSIHVQCVAHTTSGARRTYFEYAVRLPFEVLQRK